MNEFLDSSNTNRARFEASFKAMSDAVENGDEEEIARIASRLTGPTI